MYSVKWVINGVVNERKFDELEDAQVYFFGRIAYTRKEQNNKKWEMVIDLRSPNGKILLNYYHSPSGDDKFTDLIPITL